MDIHKIRTQKNRAGRLIHPLVNIKAKVSTLETIRNKFRSPFTKFTMDEFLDKKLSSHDRDNKNKLAKQKMRIKRLVMNNWLKPDQEGKFDVTKKYKNYLNRFFCFDNPSGPLMRSKEPKEEVEKEIVEKIKEIEVTKLDKTKYLGDI